MQTHKLAPYHICEGEHGKNVIPFTEKEFWFYYSKLKTILNKDGIYEQNPNIGNLQIDEYVEAEDYGINHDSEHYWKEWWLHKNKNIPAKHLEKNNMTQLETDVNALIKSIKVLKYSVLDLQENLKKLEDKINSHINQNKE